MPDAFFREELSASLPPVGAYGVAVCFLPRDAGAAAGARARCSRTTVEAEGQTVLGWRDVPVDDRHVGLAPPGCSHR